MTPLLLVLACAAPEAPSPPPVEPPVEEVAPVEAPAPEPPTFSAVVEPIPAEMRERMDGTSWREGCPVGLDALRLMRLTHWDLEGGVAQGQLIVAEHVTDEVREAFAAAFAEGFPIARMEPIHRFGGDDDQSMAANNTSAFNCRVVGGTRRLSRHSYGTAIDINPVQNPFVRGDRVEPPAGRAYLDREDVRPGMLTADSALVESLRAHGWGWGGTWTSSKDYQHISESGR